MKKIILLIFTILLVAGVVSASGEVCGSIKTTDLIAGKHIDSGDVEVWNDGEYLYVKYITENGWKLSATHLHIGDSVYYFPLTKKGNPRPGKFDYSMTHDPEVSEYTYQISLDDVGDSGYIATHAVVEKENIVGNKVVVEEETAWAGHCGFLGNRWAMRFFYRVQECAA